MGRIEYKTPEQVAKMRRAGIVVAEALAAARAALAPGVTTAELDAVAAESIAAAGARSNFLGYHGFPATLCISVNEEIVHGIPGPRVIEPGDIVSVDCGAIVDGWHADSAFSVVVPPAEPADLALVAACEGALWAGIAALARSERLGEVGSAIEASVSRAGEYSIVREYVGHGIGTALHQDPEVRHYRSLERGPKVVPGLCVAIEPMITLGGRGADVLDDGWTVVTTDGSRASHWEHTVAVLEGGVCVLTEPDGGASRLAPFGVRPVDLAA